VAAARQLCCGITYPHDDDFFACFQVRSGVPDDVQRRVGEGLRDDVEVILVPQAACAHPLVVGQNDRARLGLALDLDGPVT
jgi:hypothetical protein